jgi:hypothetical protein
VRVAVTVVACRDQAHRVPRAALSLVVVHLYRKAVRLRAVPLTQAVPLIQVVPQIQAEPLIQGDRPIPAAVPAVVDLPVVDSPAVVLPVNVPPADVTIERIGWVVAPVSTAALVPSATSAPLAAASFEIAIAETLVAVGRLAAAAIGLVTAAAAALARAVASCLPTATGRLEKVVPLVRDGPPAAGLHGQLAYGPC